MPTALPRIALLPGDGPGPQLAAAAREVLAAAGFRAEWSEHEIGGQPWRTQGTSVPAQTVQACWDAEAIFFGSVVRRDDAATAEAELPADLRARGHTWVAPILRLKEDLDLWIDVRPVQGNGYDLIVYRPNRMGLYAGFEARPIPDALREVFPALPSGPDTAVTLRVVSRSELERLYGFVLAESRAMRRENITLLEKPTRMPATGGLTVDVLREFAGEHDLPFRIMNCDAALAHLVRDAAAFDLVVGMPLITELFSDLAAQLAGGLALHASASIGDGHALFQPVIDAAPDIADVMGPPNPVGAVRAGAMMARHVGQPEVAERIESSVWDLLLNGGRHEWTPDIGGTGNTVDVTQSLIERVQSVVATGN